MLVLGLKSQGPESVLLPNSHPIQYCLSWMMVEAQRALGIHKKGDSIQPGSQGLMPRSYNQSNWFLDLYVQSAWQVS